MKSPTLAGARRAFAAVAAACFAVGATSATSAAPPPPLPRAEAVAALPGGHWLVLDKRALRLLDASGTERASLALRGEHLDSRPTARGALAVLLDADTQRTLAVDVDLQRMAMTARTVMDSPPWSVEALCMHRDPQGHDHVFIVGDEGLAEQWVLRDDGALLVRRLALPPQTRQCAVDDAAQQLVAAEEGQPPSAYNAAAEGQPRRQPLAGAQGAAPVAEEVSASAAGVALLDARGHVQLWRAQGERWVRVLDQRLGPPGRAELLRVQPADGPGAAGVLLQWFDKDAKAWRARRVAGVPAVPAAGAASLPASAMHSALPVVLPRAQTEPVARYGDAADDPAIWVHPGDPARSLVVGTNKKQGLLVYDLAGRQRQLLESGRLNNVDLRQRVRLGGRELDLAVATQRDDLSVVVYGFDGEGLLRELARLPTGLKEIYGLCLHQPRGGGLEVFVNDKDGSFQRHRLALDGERITSRVVQRFRLASQPEACVADDAAGMLYMGEEKRGVWAMPLADERDRPALALVLPVGPWLRADVEGLALYQGNPEAPADYLVVSSQGNHSYVVVDARPPYTVRGAFRIGMNLAAGIDGASETDGLEVTARPLGPEYPRGALVVQDGFKRLPDGPQNFKIVDWRDVASALGLQ